MEVKEILEKIRRQDEGKKEAYFALQIGQRVVKAAVWLVEKGEVKVAAFGKGEPWSEKDGLLAAVDAALSSASEGFLNGSQSDIKEPSQVIFGLPADWVEEEKIFPDKLRVLKNISEKLELVPVGFVVTPEAISHYLKVAEGVPPTAILIALSREVLVLTLIRLGKNFRSQVVKRSQKLGEDVVEGLSRYQGKEPLPARILVYDGESSLESARQELTAYSWQEGGGEKRGVTFLHLPRIEVLAVNFDIKAVALAGGREVAQAAGLQAEITTEKGDALQEDEGGVASGGQDQQEAVKGLSFGFVKGRDIRESGSLGNEADQEKVTELQSASVVGDISAGSQHKVSAETSLPIKEDLPSKSSWPSRLGSLRSALSFLKKIKFQKSLLKPKGLFSRFSGSNKFPLMVGLVLGLLLITGGMLGLAYWRLPKASVTIFLEPETLEEEFEVKLDSSVTETDPQNLILPAKVVKIELQEEASRGTTETKLIGEEAKGEVIIYNGTSQEKAFESGTLIASSSGLEFSIDEKVTVASQSGTAADPTPGKTTAKVTAVEIGSQGNLAADTQFTVANYSQSDYVAQNDLALSGGTSREVLVVVQEDHDELLSELTEQMKASSVHRLGTEVSAGKKLLEESIESEVVEKNYSHDVEEESSQVSLKLSLRFSGLEYDEDLMRQLIERVVKDKVPAGFEFRPEESQVNFELQEMTKNGEAVFIAKLSVNLVPQLELEEIRRNLVGKLPYVGKTYLENLPGVVGTEILISPELPSRLMTFPRLIENIEVSSKVR